MVYHSKGRKLNVLYGLLLTEHQRRVDNITHNDYYICPTICKSIELIYNNGLIDKVERLRLKEHLYYEKPSELKNYEFFDEPHYNGNVCWWSALDKDFNACCASRLHFINYLRIKTSLSLLGRVLYNLGLKKIDYKTKITKSDYYGNYRRKPQPDAKR